MGSMGRMGREKMTENAPKIYKKCTNSDAKYTRDCQKCTRFLHVFYTTLKTDSRRKTQDSRQKTEDRGQKTEWSCIAYCVMRIAGELKS